MSLLYSDDPGTTSCC